MKNFWIALAKKAVAAYFAKDWDKITAEVYVMVSEDIPGEEKKKRIYAALRQFGMDCATWLLYAGIALAWEQIKAQLEKQNG